LVTLGTILIRQKEDEQNKKDVSSDLNIFIEKVFLSNYESENYQVTFLFIIDIYIVLIFVAFNRHIATSVFNIAV
jgi:hypothetical protein